MTSTTVGYGDISPVTPEGRIIAVLLMLVGIGVIGAFTATVASFFVTQGDGPDLVALQAQLARVEAKLDRLLSQDRDAAVDLSLMSSKLGEDDRPMRNTRVTLAFVIAALRGASTLSAETFTGKVVAVQDGDTISVMRDGRAERVRLDGIDAPESGQDFSNRAKQFLSELVFGRLVAIETRDTDRYGRIVARVVVDDRDTGLELVRAGLAWHYVRYSNDPLLASAEREARLARRGLWVQPNAVPPWEFRHLGNTPRGSAGSEPRANGPYHGNLRSKVFHAPGCQHYDCPNCRAEFTSVSAAQGAGFRPHTACVR